MLRSRSPWLRLLRLYEGGHPGPVTWPDDHLVDTRVHAFSRFRHVGDPTRHAVYSVHHGDGAGLLPTGLFSDGALETEHTLVVVREFRRVPLDASVLALTTLTADPGRGVAVVATLAHFVERAVDLYQPAYLLLAHSLEEPRISLLLTGVQDALALATGPAADFRVEMPVEIHTMLERPPERYVHAPDLRPVPVTGVVSPYAV